MVWSRAQAVASLRQRRQPLYHEQESVSQLQLAAPVLLCVCLCECVFARRCRSKVVGLSNTKPAAVVRRRRRLALCAWQFCTVDWPAVPFCLALIITGECPSVICALSHAYSERSKIARSALLPTSSVLHTFDHLSLSYHPNSDANRSTRAAAAAHRRRRVDIYRP